MSSLADTNTNAAASMGPSGSQPGLTFHILDQVVEFVAGYILWSVTLAISPQICSHNIRPCLSILHLLWAIQAEKGGECMSN